MFDREKFHEQCVEEIYRNVNGAIERALTHGIIWYCRDAAIDGLLRLIARQVLGDHAPTEAKRRIQERAALLPSQNSLRRSTSGRRLFLFAANKQKERPMTPITEWPHHVRAKITVMGDYNDIFISIANRTRGLDPALIKKLIAQHELAVAVYPSARGLSPGLAPLKGFEHFGLAAAVMDFVARYDADDGFASGPPPEVSPVIDTTVFAFWCATAEEAAELQRVYCGFSGHGRN
jgi:hypothetical protein